MMHAESWFREVRGSRRLEELLTLLKRKDLDPVSAKELYTLLGRTESSVSEEEWRYLFRRAFPDADAIFDDIAIRHSLFKLNKLMTLPSLDGLANAFSAAYNAWVDTGWVHPQAMDKFFQAYQTFRNEETYILRELKRLQKGRHGPEIDEWDRENPNFREKIVDYRRVLHHALNESIRRGEVKGYGEGLGKHDALERVQSQVVRIQDEVFDHGFLSSPKSIALWKELPSVVEKIRQEYGS